MKKQKFMKLIAYTSDPDLGNSFGAPATHDDKISVVFRERDIAIYGHDGSAWYLIYTWNGSDKQFIFDNSYENYFLKSLTGSQESVGVSFFSSTRHQGSTPSLAGIDRGVKFYDINEVPIYTASDEGKFLTVRSDGSLAWLAENESYTVESEGEEGGGDPASPPANFLDDLERLNLPNGIYTDNGHGMTHMLKFYLNGDNIIEYGNDGQPAEEEFTISWWMKLNNSQAANSVSILGADSPKRFSMNITGASANGIPNPNVQVRVGNNYIFNNGTGVAMGGNWVHCAITCKSNGSNLIVRVYLNGNKLPGSRSFALGSKLLPSAANDQFSFGGSGQSGKSVKGQFDSMQIEDGIALTDEQVAAIAAQTDRQMGIEAASQI